MEIKVENLDPSKFYISKTYGDYWQLEGSNEMLKIIKLLHLVKG